jgi:monovalent cation:proton antiporter-2 (CPA2) family protein
MFFVQLLLILVATKLAGDLSTRIGQPAVLGKLIVGVILGPAVLGWIEESDMIHQMSEIGVLLLMFLAGLETDIHELNKSRTSSLAVAVGGVILPLVGGYLIGTWFGMEPFTSWFLGALFSATSVSITVQTLRDLGKLQTKESVTILGAAIADDVIVVVLLAFLMSFSGLQDVSLGLVIGQKILFFALIILLGWKVVPWAMKWMTRIRASEIVVSSALMICFAFAFMAEEMGVAGIIGSFAAGLSLSQTKVRHEIEEKLNPIAYSVFVPIFFVSIGLPVTFEGLGNQIGLIVALSIMAVFSKWIGCGLGARLTGFNTASSISIGSGMISRGEVALIIVSLGLSQHLLPAEWYTSTILVVILTTIITPPLLKITFQKMTPSKKEKPRQEALASK